MRDCKSCSSPAPESDQSWWFGIVAALLHGSCCWLPVSHRSETCARETKENTDWQAHSQTILDFLSIGSASATALHRFQPVFLGVTFIALAHIFHREGLSHRNLLRIALSFALLLIPRVLRVPAGGESEAAHHGDCH